MKANNCGLGPEFTRRMANIWVNWSDCGAAFWRNRTVTASGCSVGSALSLWNTNMFCVAPSNTQLINSSKPKWHQTHWVRYNWSNYNSSSNVQWSNDDWCNGTVRPTKQYGYCAVGLWNQTVKMNTVSA
jgi:hypothetical protein